MNWPYWVWPIALVAAAIAYLVLGASPFSFEGPDRWLGTLIIYVGTILELKLSVIRNDGKNNQGKKVNEPR